MIFLSCWRRYRVGPWLSGQMPVLQFQYLDLQLKETGDVESLHQKPEKLLPVRVDTVVPGSPLV